MLSKNPRGPRRYRGVWREAGSAGMCSESSLQDCPGLVNPRRVCEDHSHVPLRVPIKATEAGNLLFKLCKFLLRSAAWPSGARNLRWLGVDSRLRWRRWRASVVARDNKRGQDAQRWNPDMISPSEATQPICRSHKLSQANVRCSRRAPAGLPYERRASGIAEARIASVDACALAAELGR